MAREGGPEAKNLSETKRLDRRFDRRAFRMRHGLGGGRRHVVGRHFRRNGCPGRRGCRESKPAAGREAVGALSPAKPI